MAVVRALTPSTAFYAGSNKSLYGHAIVVTNAAAMLNTDTAGPICAPNAGPVSMQVTGTFGSGTVTLKGSNDGTNFVVLKDQGNTAIAVTSAGIVSTNQICAFYQAEVTGGDGTTSLTVTLCIVSPL